MKWRRLIPGREALLANRWLRWLAPCSAIPDSGTGRGAAWRSVQRSVFFWFADPSGADSGDSRGDRRSACQPACSSGEHADLSGNLCAHSLFRVGQGAQKLGRCAPPTLKGAWIVDSTAMNPENGV